MRTGAPAKKSAQNNFEKVTVPKMIHYTGIPSFIHYKTLSSILIHCHSILIHCLPITLGFHPKANSLSATIKIKHENPKTSPANQNRVSLRQKHPRAGLE